MTRSIGMALLALAVGSTAWAGEDRAREVGHVRPIRDRAARLLEEARQRSTTVASQLARIEASDTFVYVNVTVSPGRRLAETGLMAATPEARYLLVSIDARRGLQEQIVLLGHELQHVLEIASSPGVRDRRTFASFFRRVGLDSRAERRFETEAARLVAHRVRAEILTPAKKPLPGRPEEQLAQAP